MIKFNCCPTKSLIAAPCILDLTPTSRLSGQAPSKGEGLEPKFTLLQIFNKLVYACPLL